MQQHMGSIGFFNSFFSFRPPKVDCAITNHSSQRPGLIRRLVLYFDPIRGIKSIQKLIVVMNCLATNLSLISSRYWVTPSALCRAQNWIDYRLTYCIEY